MYPKRPPPPPPCKIGVLYGVLWLLNWSPCGLHSFRHFAVVAATAPVVVEYDSQRLVP